MYKNFFKRLLDILISLIGIIVASPILLILYILVVIFMGFPAIFKQKRPGKDEKIFNLYKFRTMTIKKDKNGKLLPDEKRLTGFGKFLRKTSLDELPELFNILFGQMSFIGPRPLLVEYLDYYTEEEHHRHDIRPGLTGWAQVNGRNNLDWDERFKKDLEYVNSVNLMFDIKIVFMTIKKVLFKEDIQMGEDLLIRNLDEERNNKKNILKINYSFYKAHKNEFFNLILDLMKDYYTSKKIIKNMGTFLKNNSAHIFCYRDNGVIVGFIWAYIISKKRLHINYFVVDKKYRSKGIGKLLINEIKNISSKNEYIELLVDKNNIKAIKFYKKNKYIEEEYNDEKIKMVLNIKKQGDDNI